MAFASVPVQSVLFTVFQSIFQVFLLCLAGFALSFKGIVDKPTSKVLNHINITLFTPALLFSKVAFFLTPAKLRQLWVIPIFFTLVTGLSALAALWLARAFRLKRSQANFAIAASMFMNSNSLPVALMQSLATTVPLLKWGQDDTIDAMFGRSLTYLVVFSTLGMILRWSYGIHLLSQADDPDSTTPAQTTYRDVDTTDEHPALSHVAVDSPTVAQLVDYEPEIDVNLHDRITRHVRPFRSGHPHSRITHVSRRHPHPHMHLHSHLPAAPTSLGDHSESEDSDERETIEGDSEDTIALRSDLIDTGCSTEIEDPAPAPARTSHPSSSSSSPEHDVHSTPRWNQHARPSLIMRLLTILTSLSPPLVASLLAIFCVLVPPVQRLLNSDEMIPFRGALDNAGACSIPLTLIVLGGWFWDGEAKAKGTGGRGGEGKVNSGDSHANAKSKGKGVEKRHGHSHGHENGNTPTLADERQDRRHRSTTGNTLSLPERHVSPQSRESSAGSLSSLIGSFGDVLMSHIHTRGDSRRAKRRTRGSVVVSKGDVEPGLLATHTERENENTGNGLGRPTRSRSQTDHVNGRARLSPTSSSSPTSVLPAPKPPHARETNLPGETLTIFVTLLARMVIVPLIVTPMLVLVSRLGWGGQVFEDPVFVVSSMLLVASPPALTLAQISQRAKSTTGGVPDANANVNAFSPFERLLSRTVFWAYCILTPPMTIASVMVGLLLIGA